MQPQRAHSLPPRPTFTQNAAPGQPGAYTAAAPALAQNRGMLAAQALTSTLSNPYAQHQYQAPHYAQAYAQYYNAAAHGQTSTPQGYTYSSTYDPNAAGGAPGPARDTQQQQQQQQQPQRQQASNANAQWYGPGSSRCAKPGCGFAGSAKAVEVHMMDRHLIYPPGWDKRKRSDWDADPSLKGKPIPIQGTSIKLNTPEAIEGWIAERKKRWPTADRVEDKKRKLEEAIARGQIIEDPSLRGKRRRTDEGDRATDSGW
ncbi:hypothetical protein EVG20_g11525, partial [Dentipellis fragilis]